MTQEKSKEPSGLTSDHLVSELLRERRRDRRAGFLKMGLVGLGALIYLGWMSFIFAPPSNIPSKPFAAVVKVSGPIGPGKEASYENLAPLLRKAFENPNSKGVVLSINSPGGTPVQSSLIHDLVVELKQKHKKPVIAVGEDMMTSGAYFIAVAADSIVVNRSTVAGSIGVISAGFGFSGLMEKLGIERRVVTAGESKNLLDSFKPSSDKDVEKQKELLAAIHEHFKEVVIEGRGRRLDLNTPGLFEGQVWTGDQAVKVGIADATGSLHGVVKDQLLVDDMVTMARRKSMLESMVDVAGVKVLGALVESQAAVPQAVYP